MKPTSASRLFLLRWIGWFFLVNTLLSCLVFANYLKVLPSFEAIAGITSGGVVLGWFLRCATSPGALHSLA